MYAHWIGGDGRCEKGIVAALVKPEVHALRGKTIIHHTFICTAGCSSQSFLVIARSPIGRFKRVFLYSTQNTTVATAAHIYTIPFSSVQTCTFVVAVIHTTTVRPVFYSGRPGKNRNNGISEEIRPKIKNETLTSFRITTSLKKNPLGSARRAKNRVDTTPDAGQRKPWPITDTVRMELS